MKQILIVAAVLGLLVSAGWTQDQGASIYRSKCASCHGANGGGKTGPNLKTTRFNEDRIQLLLQRGGNAYKAPHKKRMNGMRDHQIEAVARYVKSLGQQ
jgi:mono/diheme cytochrome c family protein